VVCFSWILLNLFSMSKTACSPLETISWFASYSVWACRNHTATLRFSVLISWCSCLQDLIAAFFWFTWDVRAVSSTCQPCLREMFSSSVGITFTCFVVVALGRGVSLCGR
jgi:hypothetical protein